MLHFVVFLFLSTCCCANAPIETPTNSCRTSSSLELARRKGCYQNKAFQDSGFAQLQKESLKKIELLQQDPEFRTILAELQNSASNDVGAFSKPIKETKSELYVFISFSMGEKALSNLAHEAKQYNATLVLRGFKNGSYRKTAQSLQKIITKTGQGVLIDPELYTLFHVTAVPTFILTKPFPFQSQERIQTPIHDKLQGYVSVRYALETFAKEGDLKEEAQSLLKKGVTP